VPRTLSAWKLGPSTRHGVGVFATRDLKPYTRIGHVHTLDLGSLSDDFVSLPGTGHIVGDRVWGITGGFPFWYLNYGRPGNVELGDDGDLLTTSELIAGDELLLRLPLDR
jgi:hypothetical protein